MIWPLPNPSRTFHAVCAYWLISSKGSRAQAPTQQASMNEDSATVSATGCRTHPPHTLSAHILSHWVALRLPPHKGGIPKPRFHQRGEEPPLQRDPSLAPEKRLRSG